MPTNAVFDTWDNSVEQTLIDDLVVESIQIYGINTYYMIRQTGDLDDLINEDDLPSFNQADLVEMYIKNVDSFEGEGDFLSKFGLTIRDSITFTVAITSFQKEVANYNALVRPREGDLIYLPLNKKIYEIVHVEHEAIFYQLGKLQTYDLKCELLEYSNEVFNTGVPEIDNWLTSYVTTANNTMEGIEDIDPLADNFTIEVEADNILDWSEGNPFGEDNF